MKKTTLAVSLLCLSMSSVQARITTENENLPDEKQTASQVNQQQLIERMRNTWRNNFVPSGSVASGLSTEYIAALNHSANNLWKGINKNAPVAQLWEDTVLDDESTSGRLKLGTTLYTVYQRLFILAKAWATPGTDLYKDTQLYTVLKSALINLNLDYYNDQTPEWGNWWNWELGISRSVNNTLVILYEELPASLINKYNLATRHFVRDPRYLAEGSGAPYSTTKNAFTSTGGNRIDSAMVVFVRGLLANDPTEINAAVVSVPEVLNTVQSGDGFYQDGSFIQHKDLAYSGTYGQVLLNGLGLIKNSVAGTPWDFSSEDNRRIYSVIRDAFLPLLLEGKMPDAVNGRSIARKNGQDRDVGASVMNAIALFVNGAPAEDKRHIEQVLKAQLNRNTAEYYHSHLPENLTSWQVITRIQQDKDLTPAHPIPGAKLYADMDRLVYQGANYQAVVAMHSNRTGSYECINNENLKGQRTS
ncbi:MAG: polysaccharide lyase family 8 super-sandwich domain-containing protein, partial [Acinetobacter sp.]